MPSNASRVSGSTGSWPSAASRAALPAGIAASSSRAGRRGGQAPHQRRPRHRFQHVGRRVDQLGAFADQDVAALGQRAWIEPGIANTSLPCSAAWRAVMSEPD
jgi:hypothetical protein